MPKTRASKSRKKASEKAHEARGYGSKARIRLDFEKLRSEGWTIEERQSTSGSAVHFTYRNPDGKTTKNVVGNLLTSTEKQQNSVHQAIYLPIFSESAVQDACCFFNSAAITIKEGVALQITRFYCEELSTRPSFGRSTAGHIFLFFPRKPTWKRNFACQYLRRVCFFQPKTSRTFVF